MSPEQIKVERKAFEASLKTMPEWAPEFEPHRAWVEQYAFFAWLARAEKAQRVRDALEAILSDFRHPGSDGWYSDPVAAESVDAARAALKD